MADNLTKLLLLKLEPTLLECIDAHVRNLELSYLGISFSRNDAVRDLISIALDKLCDLEEKK